MQFFNKDDDKSPTLPGDHETLSKDSSSDLDTLRKKVKTDKSPKEFGPFQTSIDVNPKLEQNEINKTSVMETSQRKDPKDFFNLFPYINPMTGLSLQNNMNFQRNLNMNSFDQFEKFGKSPSLMSGYHYPTMNYQPQMGSYAPSCFQNFGQSHLGMNSMQSTYNPNFNPFGATQNMNYSYPYYMNGAQMMNNSQNYMQSPPPIIITRYISTYESPKSLFLKNSDKKRQENDQNQEIDGASDQQQNPSRFHNLNKLFMYSILKCLQKQILMSFNFSEELVEDILKVVNGIKDSSKRKKEADSKSDFFNHRHYNALFLKLDPKLIEKIGADPKEVEIHKTCFNIDLLDKTLQQSKLDQINMVKKAIYEVFAQEFSIENDESSSEIRKTTRGMYLEKAVFGISKLSKGILVHRF